jgi:hypothetical protein
VNPWNSAGINSAGISYFHTFKLPLESAFDFAEIQGNSKERVS